SSCSAGRARTGPRPRAGVKPAPGPGCSTSRRPAGSPKRARRRGARANKCSPERTPGTRPGKPPPRTAWAWGAGAPAGNTGVAADLVVAQGGTAVPAETPEIYGAEHLLTRRAVSPEVGQKLIDRIRWWEWYAGLFGGEINNNPSPGNKNGGLTTIYEKSLGAMAKAGSSPLVDVVGYAERVDTAGLVFMDTPGYDPPCTTGLIARG